jgi:Na+/H+ antiporter NhaD/arsenite permease-like protein
LDTVVVLAFCGVYLGMVLGRWPWLRLDRTGIALIGAIALIVARRIEPHDAWDAVDVPTMALLFGLMVISAQLRLGGFYARLTRRIAAADVGPQSRLGLVVVAAGVLSALLANDIVCLAMAPVLIDGCTHRRLNPLPFLLALACAANVGSAATLIGNPQNMLIGQSLGLSFGGYLLDGGVPAAVGLLAVWCIIGWQFRGQWRVERPVVDAASPAFNPWQTGKGLFVLTGLIVAFLAAPWPREVMALAAAGIVLTSRRMHTRDMLGLVDWQLLVLFAGLFIVNHVFQASGAMQLAMDRLSGVGVDATSPFWLFVLAVVLSNLVSNVPAVMLLLPAATHRLGGPVLALASTLAGNLFIVGSIANIIVVDQAARMDVRIGWREHARTGVPVTIATLAIAAAWLAFRAWLPRS